jgi:hypothetical protein
LRTGTGELGPRHWPLRLQPLGGAVGTAVESRTSDDLLLLILILILISNCFLRLRLRTRRCWENNRLNSMAVSAVVGWGVAWNFLFVRSSQSNERLVVLKGWFRCANKTAGPSPDRASQGTVLPFARLSSPVDQRPATRKSSKPEGWQSCTRRQSSSIAQGANKVRRILSQIKVERERL